MSLGDYYRTCAIPKCSPVARPVRFVKGIVARLRSRKKRQDDTYAAVIREQVSARDGLCRYGLDVSPGNRFAKCSGPSQWCHLWGKKRSMTRGLPPEERHSTEWTVQFCARHHEAEERHRLIVIPKSSRGADGPLRYREIGQ